MRRGSIRRDNLSAGRRRGKLRTIFRRSNVKTETMQRNATREIVGRADVSFRRKKRVTNGNNREKRILSYTRKTNHAMTFHDFILYVVNDTMRVQNTRDRLCIHERNCEREETKKRRMGKWRRKWWRRETERNKERKEGRRWRTMEEKRG